jgi:hypothetical protein
VKGLRAAGGIRFPQPSLIAILCTVLFVIGLPVSAQSVESALARSGYSQRHKDSIVAFFAEMKDADIPDALLLPKLEEGIAKGIPAPRVLGALMKEAGHLRRSRALMLRSQEGKLLLADPATWARTANLLAVGVSEEEIQELIALCSSRTEGYRPATYLYVAVLQWGLARMSALDLIDALLASSIPPESYMGLMDLLAGGRRRRIAPEELVQRIRLHLEHAESLKELEKWIY